MNPTRTSDPHGGSRGFSLLEVMVAASLVGCIVFFATNSMDSMTKAGNQGVTRLEAVSGNQRPLLFIANDLQAASTDTDPDTGLARFTITTGDAVVGLRNVHDEPDGEDDGYLRVSGDPTVTPTIDQSRDTPEERLAAGEIGTGLDRARDVDATHHSVLTFHKVVGYSVDETSGEVTPAWSTPITYRVDGERHLVRAQDGQTRVIGRDVTLFHVAVDDLGNFVLTLITEKHDARTGEVIQVSNRIEVSPKN